MTEESTGSMPTQSRQTRQFIADVAVCLILMALLLGAVYIARNDTYSVIDYLDGVGDFVTAPLFPGVFLYYPPIGLVILLAALVQCAKIKKRALRLSAIFGIVFSWMCLGLLTMVQYYG